MSRWFSALNVAGSYLAWWGCVLGVLWNHPFLGTVPTWLYLGAHLQWTDQIRREGLFLLVAIVAGTTLDSMFAATGLLIYKGGYPGISWLAPLWITALWGGFAATLNHSLGWMRRKKALAAILAGLVSPLSYYGGVRLGVLKFAEPLWWPALWLGVSWFVLIPALLILADKIGIGES